MSIVVAINKIDLDGADIDKVKGDLASKDLTPEDWEEQRKWFLYQH